MLKFFLRTILFNLPKVITPSTNTFFIAGGERDCLTLEEMGFTATTNPYGAEKWKDEFSPFFLGCDVVVFVDNDVPGLRHGFKVALSVRNFARSIRLIQFTDVGEGGDITDWIQAGHTKEDLLSRVHNEPGLTPEIFHEISKGLKKHSHNWELATCDEITGWEDPIPFFEGLPIYKETLNEHVGSGGDWKSITACEIAKSVLSGCPLFNKFSLLVEPGIVLLVNEDVDLQQGVDKLG